MKDELSYEIRGDNQVDQTEFEVGRIKLGWISLKDIESDQVGSE
jgi:hypothetical protein